MRLGFFMMPVHPPARTFTETLAEDTEKSLLADRLGFEELWLCEHFLATRAPDPPPPVVLGRPRTANQEPALRHRRYLHSQSRSDRRRRRGGAVRPHEPGTVRARHRTG